MAKWIDDIYKEIGESDPITTVKSWVDCGYIPLNLAISQTPTNGFPCGRIVEIFGGESSGKTRLATKAMISAQKQGGFGVFFDFERSFDLRLAKADGLDDERSKFMYRRPKYAEEAFDQLAFLVNKAAEASPDTPIVAVVDSVAALVTKDTMEGDFSKKNMKEKLEIPSLLSQALPKLSMLIGDTNCCLIFLNQVRDNVGVIYGDKEKTTGGKSLPFYASVRIKLRKSKKEKDDDKVVAENIVAEIIKNKVGKPWNSCTYITHSEYGIDLVASHVADAIENGLVDAKGAWINYGEKKFNGRTKMIEALRSNPAEYADFLKHAYGLGVAA